MPVNFLNEINIFINPNLAKGKWNSGSGTYAGNVCCLDCYFGFINGGVVTKNVISGFTTRPNNNVIVVLAESPHIDEFNYLPTVVQIFLWWRSIIEFLIKLFQKLIQLESM